MMINTTIKLDKRMDWYHFILQSCTSAIITATARVGGCPLLAAFTKMQNMYCASGFSKRRTQTQATATAEFRSTREINVAKWLWQHRPQSFFEKNFMADCILFSKLTFTAYNLK